jgi:nitroreductase
MNETIKTILERRSCRAYKPERIKDEELNLILEAGKYAASANNKQPWHFTVVTSQALLDRIVDESRRVMLASENEATIRWAQTPGFHNFHHAPTVIVISGDKQNYLSNGDCANATQNMAVAAHSLGLGSCYIASFLAAFTGEKSADLIKELRIPDGYQPFFALSLGYKSTEDKAPAPRKEASVNFIE